MDQAHHVNHVLLMKLSLDKIFLIRVVHVWMVIMKKIRAPAEFAIPHAKPANMEMDQINVLLVMLQLNLELIMKKILQYILVHATALLIIIQFILLQEITPHANVIIIIIIIK